MRNNNDKNYNVCVPVNFPDIDLLGKQANLKPDKIRALLHQMHLARISQNEYKSKEGSFEKWVYDEGYVALHTDIIKLLLSTDYKKYITFLIANGFIQMRSSPSSNAAYTPGKRSKHYKINPECLHAHNTNRHFRKEVISDITTIKAILKTAALFKTTTESHERSIPLNDIHHKLFNMEQRVRFDIKSADKHVFSLIEECLASNTLSESQLEKKQSDLGDELELISAINDGYFSTKVDKFGERLYSPLKRVSRQMRQFMSFGYASEELVCLDICNSQVYFSTLLTNPAIVESIIPEFAIINEFSEKYRDQEDFIKYAYLSRTGRIYDNWQTIRNLKSRDAAKKEIIQILFSSRRATFKGIKTFQTIYPSVWQFFDAIKSLTKYDLPFITQTYLDRKGRYKENYYHCNMSCAVQRLESRIFIQIICKALIDSGIKPFLTIHDSVYFPVRFQARVSEIINSEFLHLGVQPPKIKPG